MAVTLQLRREPRIVDKLTVERRVLTPWSADRTTIEGRCLKFQ